MNNDLQTNTVFDDKSFVRDWIGWWQKVRSNRKSPFARSLCSDLGRFYGRREDTFRWFLINRDRFTDDAPWRIWLPISIDPMAIALPDPLEEYLNRETWKKARDLILFAYAAS